MNQEIAAHTFEEMRSKGFLVIPSFLSEAELGTLVRDYETQSALPSRNENYAVTDVGIEAIALIREKLGEVLTQLSQRTDIHPDISSLHTALYFASTSVEFGWHQDHESYIALQDHYEYVNFFIPIYKPVRDKGNLCLIPWDVLQSRYPEQYEKLVRNGGTIFHLFDDRTLIDSDRGLVAELPVPIEDLKAIPQLDAGDLLLFRGDMMHRTQDVDTPRVAISLRFANPNTQVSRKELLAGGKRKTGMMIANWSEFGPLVQAFQKSGKRTMSWGELQKAAAKEQVATAGLRAKSKVIHANLWLQRAATGSLFASLQRRAEARRVQTRLAKLRNKK